MKVRKICFTFFAFINILLLISCTEKTQEICLNESQMIYADYSMHVGSVKAIKYASSIKINEKEVDIIFDHVEGENTGYLSFEQDERFNDTIYIKCDKKIENPASINKIYYKTEENDNEYYLNTQIVISDEETYDDLEPHFLNIDLALDYSFGCYNIFSDEIVIKLTNGTLGDKTSRTEEPYQKILNGVSINTSKVRITSIQYEVTEDEDFNGWKSDNYMNESIDFTENTTYVMIFFEKTEEYQNAIVFFDLVFDLTFNGDNFIITRNFYIL